MSFAKYTIQPGETFADIAQRYGMSEAELWHFDGGTRTPNAARVRSGDPKTVQPGEVILVPRNQHQKKLGGTSGTPMNTYVLAAPKTPPTTPVTVTVSLVEVAGLYKPGHDGGAGKGSGYLPGYTSGDDAGRIFINHIPRTDPAVDWQDTWKKDTQYVELLVELGPDTVTLPADVWVVWEWEDPDDPSNKDMREDAGVIVDPHDFKGDQALGAVADDNAGRCDHPSSNSGAPAYEQVAPYTMVPVPNTRTCETLVKDRRSKVRFHGTNIGGDNFKVKVNVKDHPLVSVYGGGDQTGLMTMWKRIDVEYRKMDGALDLPVDDVSPFFEKAFVQMDFTKALPAKRKDFMGATDDEEDKESAAYVKAPPTGVFENEFKPGWFLLVAAHEASKDTGTATSQQLYPVSGWGPATVREIAFTGGQRGEALVIPQILPPKTKVSHVILKEGNDTILFPAFDFTNHWPAANKCTVFLSSIDYQSDFIPGTGILDGVPGEPGAYDIRDFYYPRHRWSEPAKKWTAGGFGFGETVQIQLFSPGSWAVSGTSPSNKHNGKEYFAGRTIIYTGHNTYTKRPPDERKKEMLGTIVHEFTHALGFPHKCGYYTWENPAKNSCSMNYGNTWLYKVETGAMHTMQAGETLAKVAQDNGLNDEQQIFAHPRNAALRDLRSSPAGVQVGDQVWVPAPRAVDRFNTGTEGQHLCGRHLDGVRRVHLEDNPAMWKP